ncbi:MAG: DMT family transporter [Clostridia bacterium]|nr:DMT family transporter [Clostridia bacterium]
MTNKQKAILLMLLSTLSFSVMQLIVKLSSGTIPVMEQVFARNLITLFIALSMIIKTKVPAFGRKENQPALLGRAVLGYIGVVGYFYATTHMNVADASLLHRSSPFFTIIFAAIFLKERLKRIHIIALLIAFTGALLVINPSFNLEKITPALMGIMSAIVSGAAYVLISFLKGKESNATIIFVFSIVSCILSLIFGVTSFAVPTAMDLLMLLGIGLTAGYGQITLTQAYSMTAPGEVSIINYVGIVFSAILGLVFLNEAVSVRSLVGMILIFAAALLLYFIKNSPYIRIRKNRSNPNA